jgi:hypothetical protein
MLQHVASFLGGQGLLGERGQQIGIGMRRGRRWPLQPGLHDFGDFLHLTSVSSFWFLVSGF